MDISQTNPNEIVTYSEISRGAIQMRETRFVRAWYWLRKITINTAGHMPHEDAVQRLMEMGISRTYALQILRGGNGTWWTINHHRLILSGAKKIVQHLELRSEGALVLLKPSDFLVLQVFRAKLYASWFAQDSYKQVDTSLKPAGGKTISRKALTKAFKISKWTQKRYERKASVVKQKCFAYAKQNAKTYDHLPLSTPLGEVRGGVWRQDVDGDGKEEIVWQIPNRYCVDMDVIGRKRRFIAESGYCSRAKHARIYFDKPDGASKAIENGQPVYLLRKNIRGRTAIYSYGHK